MTTRSLNQTATGNLLSWIGTIIVKNSAASANKKYPLLFKGSEHIMVTDCNITSANAKPAVLTKNVQDVRIVGNTILDMHDLPSAARNASRSPIQRGFTELISIEGTQRQTVNANRIITE